MDTAYVTDQNKDKWKPRYLNKKLFNVQERFKRGYTTASTFQIVLKKLDAHTQLDEEEDSEEEEDLMYYGPPPIPLKLYIDKITDWFHPFDVFFVYFTRLDRGPIGLPETLDVCDVKMGKVCVAI